jgi:hypothetical protein
MSRSGPEARAVFVPGKRGRPASHAVTGAGLAGSLLAIVLLVACGGHGAEGSGPHGHEREGRHAGGEAHGEHARALPPELQALHGVLAPVWHSEPGARRTAAACDAAATLVARAQAVADAAVPDGAEAGAWGEATADLVQTSRQLAAACGASAPESEAKLTAFHDAFHALVDLLAAAR